MKLTHFHTFKCFYYGDQVPRISQEFSDSGEILRNFVGQNSWEFLRDFSKLSLKPVIPQKSVILGTNSGKFFENFRGISYRKGFSRNSSEILPKKSPWLETLRKLLTFITWERIQSVHSTYNWWHHLTYKKCISDLQKVYIRPMKIVNPTYKKCTSDLKELKCITYLN